MSSVVELIQDFVEGILDSSSENRSEAYAVLAEAIDECPVSERANLMIQILIASAELSKAVAGLLDRYQAGG